MGISRREAYETLELPFGVDQDSIRTSYKRLAMKWHPDKHKNSPESIKNFLELSMAYKRLNIESDIVQMSVPDCLELFQKTINPPKQGYSNGFNHSEEEYSEDDDDDDDDYEFLFQGKFGSSGLHRFQEANSRTKLTPEEIEKNANELITEEEKEKRRAEKRRAKKKRRREKKRQEKAAEQKKQDDEPKKKPSKKENGTETSKVKSEKTQNESAESETEDFDRSAAFFTQVINKKKKSNVPDVPVNPKNKSDMLRPINANENENSVDVDLDPVVLRSRQLAIEGNKMANVGEYQAAIDLFSEAVRLDPRDFRFFGNRSYCYDRMQQYEKALKDADKAILLAPDWPKGYFRKGRALAGLKLFADAEQAFMQVLKLDRNCEDAMSELMRVRTHQLTDMGFTQQEAQSAIRQYDSVQHALDSLLAGVAETSLRTDVYNSDEEDYRGSLLQNPHPPHHLLNPLPHHPLNNSTSHTNNQKSGDAKMDPANPEGLTALWVGNVLPEVTEKKLQAMFLKYGQVTSVRLLPEKYCAFINFKTKEDAGNAMKHLQSAPCAGQQLLIKFPDNPINSTTAANNVVIRKGGTITTGTASVNVGKAATRRTQQQPHNQPNRFKKF